MGPGSACGRPRPLDRRIRRRHGGGRGAGYLREFVARGGSPLSARSYAFDLLRWWRWLKAIGVEWNRATSADVKDFVLWLKSTTKWRRHARTRSAATVGTINPVTRKQYLDDRYRARTIRHSNAVLRDFYAYWIDVGEGPLLTPFASITARRTTQRRPQSLQPFRAGGAWHITLGCPNSSRERYRTSAGWNCLPRCDRIAIGHC